MGSNGKKKKKAVKGNKKVNQQKEIKKLQKRKARATKQRNKQEDKLKKKVSKQNSNQNIHNNKKSNKTNNIKTTKTKKPKEKKNKIYIPRKRRKIKITTAQKKTIKFVISILIIVAILISSAFVFGKIFFKVENIVIHGQSQYTEDEIKNATGLSLSDNLLFCRTETIKEKIENSLPCADVISIKKELPSTLVLEIKQTKAKYNIESNNGYIYMSDDYRIFDKGSDVRDDGTVVKGLNHTFDELKSTFDNGSDGVIMIFKSIIECCDKLSFEGITEINLTNPMNPGLIYDNRIVINLGTPEDLEYKIQMANNTLTSGSIAPQLKGTLDVSLAGDKNRTYFKPDYS